MTKKATSSFRMVALDLDGTLLHSNHQMSDATVEYLRYLDEKGFVIAFATGRSAPTVYEHVIRLNLPHPLPVVCSNGAQGLLLQPSVSTMHIAAMHSDTTTIGTTGGADHADTINSNHEQRSDNVNTTVAVATSSTVQSVPSCRPSMVHSTHTLFSIPVPELVARQTIALAQSLGHVTQYYVGDAIYANPTTPQHLVYTQRYSTLTGSRTEHVIPVVQRRGCSNYQDDDDHDDDDDDHDRDDGNYFLNTMLSKGLPTKQLVLFPEDQQDAAMEAFETMVSSFKNKDQDQQPLATIVRGSLGWFLEVLHPDVTKGSGLQRLLEAEYQSQWYYDKCNNQNITTNNNTTTNNLNLESVVAFGDADNDLEFLQMAGRGIAMKNGRQVCKDVADEITEYTNDDDGVIKTLQKMEAQGLLLFSKSASTTEATVVS